MIDPIGDFIQGQCPVVNFIVWKRFIAGIFEKLSGFPYYYKYSVFVNN